jgi:hypoxanthine-DNA glycosylase
MSARKRLRGFAPVLDARARILVLGSFPSEASLAAGQYYAHPRNQFWPLMGRLLEEPLPELGYPERLRRVLAHRVGIWDVLGACERDGSLDSRIRRERANDFALLKAEAPQLKRVVFNGSTAGRFAREFGAAGFETRIAPSTSPAHASRTLEEKLELWREALHGA